MYAYIHTLFAVPKAREEITVYAECLPFCPSFLVLSEIQHRSGWPDTKAPSQGRFSDSLTTKSMTQSEDSCWEYTCVCMYVCMYV